MRFYTAWTLTGNLLLYIHCRIADIGKKYLHCSKADTGHGQQPTRSSKSVLSLRRREAAIHHFPVTTKLGGGIYRVAAMLRTTQGDL